MRRKVFVVAGALATLLTPIGFGGSESTVALSCPEGLETACGPVNLVIATACGPLPMNVPTVGAVTIDVDSTSPLACTALPV